MSQQIAVYVDSELIEKVKLKAKDELKRKTASGVVDWLIHRYVNSEAPQ